MKKLLIVLIIALPFCVKAQPFPQQRNMDTVRFSLMLKAGDFTWLIGKHGDGSDSTSRSEVRNIRQQLSAANPPTWSTAVTINKISGNMVLTFYSIFASAPYQEIQSGGENNSARTTIYTTIRAITDTTIQQRITSIDQNYADTYVQTRKRGKQILLDGSAAGTALKDTRIIVVTPPRGRGRE